MKQVSDAILTSTHNTNVQYVSSKKNQAYRLFTLLVFNAILSRTFKKKKKKKKKNFLRSPILVFLHKTLLNFVIFQYT